jgi:hypothetical protein
MKLAPNCMGKVLPRCVVISRPSTCWASQVPERRPFTCLLHVWYVSVFCTHTCRWTDVHITYLRCQVQGCIGVPDQADGQKPNSATWNAASSTTPDQGPPTGSNYVPLQGASPIGQCCRCLLVARKALPTAANYLTCRPASATLLLCSCRGGVLGTSLCPTLCTNPV